MKSLMLGIVIVGLWAASATGAVWGAATGALVGFGLIAMCSADDFLNCGGSDFVIGPAIFAGIGAGVGAAIGMAARGTTWEEVSVGPLNDLIGTVTERVAPSRS